jgi:hypothetical protein
MSFYAWLDWCPHWPANPGARLPLPYPFFHSRDRATFGAAGFFNQLRK